MDHEVTCALLPTSRGRGRRSRLQYKKHSRRTWTRGCPASPRPTGSLLFWNPAGLLSALDSLDPINKPHSGHVELPGPNPKPRACLQAVDTGSPLARPRPLRGLEAVMRSRLRLASSSARRAMIAAEKLVLS